MAEKRFEGKLAVVTGGGAGIGRAISKRLALEGARVAIFERDIISAAAVIEEIEAASSQASWIEVDVSSEASVQSAFDSLDRVDVLINNAGIASVGNVATTTGEEMDRVYNVNVKGVCPCATAAIPRLKNSGI
ncbi:MAG: SDR family NAD(P)-dependent oxidoreductase [Opitutales bacterium]|nr:SDR family NAD(P)-dependent oxidoreductase [Opitutales bacterium]